MWKYWLGLSVLSTVMLTGCKSTGERAGEQLANWFAVQNAYAASLEKGDGGRGWHYRPVNGPAWPMGSVFDQGDRAPKATCSFRIEQLMKVDFATLPKVHASYGGGFSVDAPDGLRKALQAAVLGAKLDVKDDLALDYYDLKLDYVDNTALVQRVADDQCFSSVEDFLARPKEVVRAHVRGKLKVSSSKGFNANATVKTEKFGEYTVRFDNQGGFELDDANEKTRFWVVAYLRAEAVDLERLSKMTKEELKKYLGERGYSNVQSLGLGRDAAEDVTGRLAAMGRMHQGKLVLPAISNEP